MQRVKYDKVPNLQGWGVVKSLAVSIRSEAPPRNYIRNLLVLLPIAGSLILQRLFHIVDNRFLGWMGTDALLVHNIQYSFIVFGQFLGLATATSALVFWKRPEMVTRQLSVLTRHLSLVVGSAVGFAAVFLISLPFILNNFGLPAHLRSVGMIYLSIGMVNMVLQAIFVAMDGFLIASGAQNLTLILAIVLLSGNIVFDWLATSLFLSSSRTVGDLSNALTIVGGSTTVMLLLCAFIAYRVVRSRATVGSSVTYSEIYPVWGSEFGLAVIRAAAPVVSTWQFAQLMGSPGFIVTHNLALHIAYVLCLPLIAGGQIAVRDASESQAGDWLHKLMTTAFLPTSALLLIATALPSQVLSVFYGYLPPADHLAYLSVFFFACLVGQVGNVLAVPLRAAKKNIQVTRNFFFAEIGVLLGGTQILIASHSASPATVGWVTLAFSTAFVLLNAKSQNTHWIPARRDLSFRLTSYLGLGRGLWNRSLGRASVADSGALLVGRHCQIVLDRDAAIECKGGEPADKPNNPFLPRARSLGMPTHWSFLEHPTGRETKIRIGENGRLILERDTLICRGAYFSIWKDAALKIGSGSYIGNDVFIATSLGMTIGKNSMIGLGTVIMDYDGHPIALGEEESDLSRGGAKKPIEIGDNVWIGFHCSILKGVKIGSGSVIGSRSVVTADVPPNTIVAGNPARIVRKDVKWSP